MLQSNGERCDEDKFNYGIVHLLKNQEYNPTKHFPSVNIKYMYAAAIIKIFRYLATKQEDQDGGVSLIHDVFFTMQ